MHSACAYFGQNPNALLRSVPLGPNHDERCARCLRKHRGSAVGQSARSKERYLAAVAFTVGHLVNGHCHDIARQKRLARACKGSLGRKNSQPEALAKAHAKYIECAD
jgi:hypothetical protein